MMEEDSSGLLLVCEVVRISKRARSRFKLLQAISIFKLPALWETLVKVK